MTYARRSPACHRGTVGHIGAPADCSLAGQIRQWLQFLLAAPDPDAHRVAKGRHGFPPHISRKSQDSSVSLGRWRLPCLCQPASPPVLPQLYGKSPKAPSPPLRFSIFVIVTVTGPCPPAAKCSSYTSGRAVEVEKHSQRCLASMVESEISRQPLPWKRTAVASDPRASDALLHRHPGNGGFCYVQQTTDCRASECQ